MYYPHTMTQATMSRSVRRTQVERRAATRKALLTAALECLIEHGYSGTTTGLVCERAGVSRGALLHHFGTRAELVAATLAELANRREEDIERAVNQLPTDRTRVRKALDLLWSWYTEPLFYASVDIGVAARTDAELRATVAPVEDRLSRATLLRCREMFAGDPEARHCDQAIQIALGMVRGLALLPVLQPGASRAEQQWRAARGELETVIAGCR
jgi:AcrR family transcriptional regulator